MLNKKLKPTGPKNRKLVTSRHNCKARHGSRYLLFRTGWKITVKKKKPRRTHLVVLQYQVGVEVQLERCDEL